MNSLLSQCKYYLSQNSSLLPFFDPIQTTFVLSISKQRPEAIYSKIFGIALTRILETVVTFHFSGCKVFLMNKGCHTCMIKHTMHVQSLHCSTYLTWLDVCIYVLRSHFPFLKRMLGKG